MRRVGWAVWLLGLAASMMLGTGDAHGQVASCVPQPGSPPPCIVEASVTPQQPYIGQQVTYSFRLFSRVTLAQNPPIYQAPPFEGFWLAGSPYGRFEQRTRDGVFYSVTISERLLFPLEAGTHTIAPSTLVFEETVFGEAYSLTTNSVTVEVLPLPPGAPSGFDGVVGQYALGASLDRQLVNLGEPVTLQVDVVGMGNVALLPPPALDVPATWRVFAQPARYDVSLDEGLATGAKVFTWQLFPDAPGAQVLPPIRLVTFDPDVAAYTVLETAPVAITVVGSAPAAAEDANVDVGVSVVMPTVFEPPSQWKPNIPAWGARIVMLMAWGAPPMVVLAVWWGQWRQQQRAARRAVLRRQGALRRARQRLSRAAGQRHDVAGEQIVAALVGYFADVTDVPESQVTSSTMRDALHAFGIADTLVDQLMAGVQLVYELRYAPSSTVEARTLVRGLRELLSHVDVTVRS